MLKIFLILTAALAAQFSSAELKTGDDVFLPTLETIQSGEALDLSQYKGHVLFVEFWASWCISCAKSFPVYNKINEELKDKGLQFISINTDESLKDAKKFLKKNPANFLVVRDTKHEAVETYEPKGYPIGYIVDKTGKIVMIEESVPEYEELKATLEALLLILKKALK